MLKESLKQREHRKGYMTTWRNIHLERDRDNQDRLQPHDIRHLLVIWSRIEELNDNE